MLADQLSALTLNEIRSETRRFVKLPSCMLMRRANVLDFVENLGNDSLSSSLRTLALERERTRQIERQATLKRKRSLNDEVWERQAMRRTGDIDSNDISEYLELPSKAAVMQCYREFFQATGMDAVSSVVCGVCSREVNMKADKVVVRSLSDIPNSHHLIPINKHPTQELYGGMLLEPQGVTGDEVNVCGECIKDLQKNIATPPRLSLANNLWIGKVPWELKQLTLPEQLLITQLYPRVYMFKLFPKSFDYRSDGSTLQRGMRGNVSTYKLDIDGITSMIKGTLMPRPPSILASIISITFVGVGSLPTRAIHSIFRVCRHVVSWALRWLKENNMKYYGDIDVGSTNRHVTFISFYGH